MWDLPDQWGTTVASGSTRHLREAAPLPHGWTLGDDERGAWAVLAGVRGLGPVGFASLLGRYGTGLAILREASSPGGVERLAAFNDVEREAEQIDRGLTPEVAQAIADAAGQAGATVARIREVGLRVVTMEDPLYPLRLAAIAMPPHVLYVLGDPTAMSAEAAVAIVGTRRATDAGRAFAARLATSLVAVGASVVSGLAVGIDGAAHAAAVHARGTTVAVIGSGHAVLHPRAHSRLAASIVAAGGAVVSELLPDIAPSKGTFPRRNRIVSGLADATVVVEAPARSGALITASWALEQGRECFMVPGGDRRPCLGRVPRVPAGIPGSGPDRGRDPATDRRPRPGRSPGQPRCVDGRRGRDGRHRRGSRAGWDASSSTGAPPSTNWWPPQAGRSRASSPG